MKSTAASDPHSEAKRGFGCRSSGGGSLRSDWDSGPLRRGTPNKEQVSGSFSWLQVYDPGSTSTEAEKGSSCVRGDILLLRSISGGNLLW